MWAVVKSLSSRAARVVSIRSSFTNAAGVLLVCSRNTRAKLRGLMATRWAKNANSMVGAGRRAPMRAIFGSEITANKLQRQVDARTDTRQCVDSTVVEIRPYWEQSLGFAEILAEVTYIDSGFDKEIQNQNGGLIQDNIEKSALFNLNNHSNQSGVAWGIGYEYQRIEYDRAIPFEYQAASADLGYWVNGATRLFVSGGIETPFDSYFDASLEDDFWEAGFQYTPNQRLNIELAAGERSFGNTIRARASYQLRRGSTEFTYEEGATTRGALGTSRRPILETDNLDSLLDGPGLGDRFVRKHGNWISTIELAKSDISVRLFSEQRDQRTTGAGGVLDDERVVGAALRWEWRLGVNSTVGLASNIARREVGTMESDLKRFSFDYAFRFSQRLSLVFLAQHANDSGDITVAGIYTENQYRLNLRVQL